MTDTPEPISGPRYDKLAVASAMLLFVALQIVAAQRIGWAFEYPLDDVYIHLAMASEFLRGGYGVNAGEYASAASSALYQVLLAPFADSDAQRFLPLVWNVVGLGLTAWLWGNALIWAGYWGVARWILAITAPLLIGSVSTAYVGMEHTLHAAASLAVVFGLARVVVEDRLNALLFIGLLFSPLFRFEGLALCTLAVIVLAIRGRPFGALLGAILTFVPIGAFEWYLLSLGLDPLPNSVQAKLVSSDDAGISFMARTLGTVTINLTKFGGLSIAGLVASVLFVANLSATVPGRLISTVGFLAAIIGISGLGYAAFDLEGLNRFVGPSIAVLFAGLLVLAMGLYRSLRDGSGDKWHIWIALALAGACAGHVALAQTGWMERYEHYAIASLAMGLVILAGISVAGRRIAILVAIAAIGLSGARYAQKSAVQYHWGSRAIYLQQQHMQRFAKEFLDRNVAVNDLGWVAWANPNYVLDLYGLANAEARRLRIFAPEDGWGGSLVERHDVSVIMIYESFVGDAVAPDWVPLGKLVMRNARGFLGGAEVDFYAADFAEVPHAEAALREWKKTLLPDTCFVRHGEDKCWN